MYNLDRSTDLFEEATLLSLSVHVVGLCVCAWKGIETISLQKYVQKGGPYMDPTLKKVGKSP